MTKEDIIKEFNTPEKLIKFVVEDCMDIANGVYDYVLNPTTKSIQILVWFDEIPIPNIDIQKLSYLNQLLDTGFDYDIEELHIENDLTVINTEFLVKLNLLKKLKWPQGIDIPELPSSLEKINQYNGRWTEVRNHLPSNNNINSYREILDKITSGDIVV